MQERYRSLNQLLMCIDRRRKQIGEEAMRVLDIQPSQHFVLVWLKHMGRAVSQSKLAEVMQVSPASVARSLKGLDRDGYIARSGGMDGRCNETVITAKGQQVLDESLALFQGLDERSYEGFSEAELAQMQGYLERMLNNLNRIKQENGEETKK